MEKVSIYVKRIIALILSFIAFMVSISLIYNYRLNLSGLFYEPIWNNNLAVIQNLIVHRPAVYILLAGAFLLFAFLDFRITGEKPRFLFGMNQSDAFLNKKGGFWNLFKWIVNLFGLIYDLIVWSIWGVYLLFVLVTDFLLLIKTIVYWIIHAIIWFLRQLFPPLVFIFKMIMHYLVNWAWWIYQVAVRNVRISVNRNFYFIALWGTIPAIFIVFLFYTVGILVDFPELIAFSYLFAVIPLAWSYGEISALRFENREKDGYSSVRASFRNGFEAIRAVLFYLLIAMVIIIAEIIFNLLGWIPNLSMSLLGISINLNMALSLVLVFLFVIIAFAGSILPTHILYKPDHANNLNSSLSFLKVIGRKFLRYTFATIPAAIFGLLLMIIPALVVALTFGITDNLKNSMLESRVNTLTENSRTMEADDAYRTEIKIDRLKMYLNVPLQSHEYFADLRNSEGRIDEIQKDLVSSRDQLSIRNAAFQKQLAEIGLELQEARAAIGTDQVSEEVTNLSSRRLEFEESFLQWEKGQKDTIDHLEADLREQRSVLVQMPILHLLSGIFIAIFGGLIFAILVAYIGNVNYELYGLREDGKPTYWSQTLKEIKVKNPNQPLLGFTFLVLILILVVLLFTC